MINNLTLIARKRSPVARQQRDHTGSHWPPGAVPLAAMDLPVDPESFSMANVVTAMNRALEDSGGSVQLKKRRGDSNTTQPMCVARR